MQHEGKPSASKSAFAVLQMCQGLLRDQVRQSLWFAALVLLTFSGQACTRSSNLALSCLSCSEVAGPYDETFVKRVCFPTEQVSQDGKYHYFYSYSDSELSFTTAYDDAVRRVFSQIEARIPGFIMTTDYVKKYVTFTQITCKTTGRIQVFVEAKVPW